MALKHLEEVLQAAGLPADQTKALVDLKDDAADFKADTYVAPLHTTIETKVKNDPAFYAGITKETLTAHAPKLMQEVESSQYARAVAITRTNLLKAAGLNEADFKELGEEGKKIEVFTPAFAKKLNDGKVTDAQLQQKLIEANNQLEELKNQLPEVEKKHKGEADKIINERSFDLIVLSTLAQIPGLKGPNLIAPGVIQTLKAKYDFAVNGLTAELRQKGKPDLKVLVNNKELTLTDAIMAEVKDLVEPPKKAEPTKGSVTVTQDGKGELKIPGKVNDKLSKRIEMDKAAAGTK